MALWPVSFARIGDAFFDLKVYVLLKISDFEEVFLGLCPNFRKSETFKHRFKVRDFEEQIEIYTITNPPFFTFLIKNGGLVHAKKYI